MQTNLTIKNMFRMIFYILIGILFIEVNNAQTEALPGHIIITEIFTRSEGNIPDYIEIYNRSTFTHSLLDWKISIFGTEYVFDSEIYGVSGVADDMDIDQFKYLIKLTDPHPPGEITKQSILLGIFKKLFFIL